MQEQGPYDDLVGRLLALRADAGSPSFGDIATTVSRVRRERGLTAERARVGRTTVYDVFRMGRRRIDAELVGDIVRALGADESVAAEMADAARKARQTWGTSATDLVDPVEAPVLVPEPAVTPPRSLPTRWMVVILVGCLVVNLLGRVLVDVLDLPVYLDMVGTAFTAIMLGPWWGALVGGLTNVVGVGISGTDSLLFTPVNIVGALLWGYGARAGWARSIPRFFGLNLVVAVVCSCVAVPVIVMIEQGVSGHGADRITVSAQVLLTSLWASVTVSNLLTSVVDKLICGFVSLTVLESLPAAVRPSWWLAGAPRPEPLGEVRSAVTHP